MTTITTTRYIQIISPRRRHSLPHLAGVSLGAWARLEDIPYQLPQEAASMQPGDRLPISGTTDLVRVR